MRGKVGGPDLKSFIQQFEGASEGDRPQEASDANAGVRTEETQAEKSEPVPDSRLTGKTCAVVTGANKGIGLEICRQLASNGIAVILTARDEKKGTEAVQGLSLSGFFHVVFQQLHVEDPISVAGLSSFVETHLRKLDILVNNAGDSGLILNCDAFKETKLRGLKMYEKAKECMEINFYRTKGVTEALLPLMQLS
ncbi:hypothetical protein QYF36_013866 [Acer negundo]|nr:hypothetical protein QYF36_013866 [Acer negundo]